MRTLLAAVVGWTRAGQQAAADVPAGLVRLVPDGPPLPLPRTAVGQAEGTVEVWFTA